MSNQPAALSQVDEQDLVRELAQVVIEQTMPEELAVFDETAAEYFSNPQRALAEGRDEPVGFGIDLALITPYVLAVATPVVRLLATMVADAVKAEGQPVITRLVRRLLRRTPTEARGADNRVALTADQVSRVRDVAFDRGRAVGLTEDRAALLADAIVGGVVVRS